MPTTPWQIPGAEAEPILGDTHMPDAAPGAAVLICHGFLGYKDYGLFPRLAGALADAGLLAHRFNLSHSGMTRRIESFERPDLFERDTWRTQAHDINAVIDAVAAGALAGAGLPIVLLGHSRGGASCLLAAADRFREDRAPLPAGVVTVSAPDACCSWDEARRDEHRRRGFTEVVSNRTGQTLRIGRAWLAEQEEDPGWHDPLAAAAAIRCPVLAIHGSDDPTVPAASAGRIAAAARDGRAVVVEGGNHVFNTPNPMPADAEPSAQLAQLIAEVIGLVGSVSS